MNPIEAGDVDSDDAERWIRRPPAGFEAPDTDTSDPQIAEFEWDRGVDQQVTIRYEPDC